MLIITILHYYKEKTLEFRKCYIEYLRCPLRLAADSSVLLNSIGFMPMVVIPTGSVTMPYSEYCGSFFWMITGDEQSWNNRYRRITNDICLRPCIMCSFVPIENTSSSCSNVKSFVSGTNLYQIRKQALDKNCGEQ